MTFSHFFRFGCFLLMAFSSNYASITQSLNATQMSELQNGGTVVLTREIPEQVWPELTLYRLIPTTPVALYDLLTDYAHISAYNPGILSAEVISQPTPTTKHIRYTAKVPVLSTIVYTVNNEYSEKNGTYQIRWNLLESPMASASTGSMTMELFGNQTILRYINHVTPSMPMAGLLKGQALKEAKSTMDTITDEAIRRAKKK